MTRAFAISSLLLAACGAETRAASVSLPEALPSPPPTASSAAPIRDGKPTVDAAYFQSERGLVHLVREGSTASGRFGASGVMTCTLAADRFDCAWYENTNEGRAALVRRPSGKLEGTWGNGTSADDQGAWTLAPLATSARSPAEGVWDTNFGEATVHAPSPDKLAIDYRDGTMQCDRRTAYALDCEWTEGGSHGHATFTIESPRVMRGTWGNNQSATDGGSWLFVRR